MAEDDSEIESLTDEELDALPISTVKDGEVVTYPNAEVLLDGQEEALAPPPQVKRPTIFLQKRDRLVDIEPDWVHLATDANGIRMNAYFVDNPEMVLGDMQMVSGPHGMESACIAYSEDIFAPKADVLGIYGQNGSGKTTFIDALEILKTLLSGQKVGAELSDCISYGQEKAELQFKFSILKLNEDNVVYKRRLIYSTVLSKDAIDETVKCATTRTDSAKTAWMKPIFACTHQSEDAVFSPQVRLESLFGSKQNAKVNELRVIKLLCQKEHRSFLFSPEFLKMLHDVAQEHDDKVEPLFELSNFANTSFFVILNRNNGLISLDAAIPVNFRTETAGGTFALPIDQPVTIPNRFLESIQQVIATISTVLCEIVPGSQLSLVELGTELMENGEQGTKIQLVRELSCANGKLHLLPLKYESEGIKKIISVLHLLIAAYNSPSITLAIDELDSGIYEYLLGELLRIMQKSGKGQLIFTSHNLYPLETLESDSIVFTTTNPSARYTRIKSVRATNNLRSMYLREVILGSDDDATLYEETNVSEIAHAMRIVGKRMESLSLSGDASSEVSNG